MSTLTDQVTEFTSLWTKLPDAHVVVERYFDFAQQVLDGQRAVVRTVLDVGGKAAETINHTAAGAARAAGENVATGSKG